MKVKFWCSKESLRQEGMPWGAIVTFNEEEGKMFFDYSAGTFQGNYMKGGMLYVDCKPGDVIAVGQGSYRGCIPMEDIAFYTVEKNGSLKRFTGE